MSLIPAVENLSESPETFLLKAYDLGFVPLNCKTLAGSLFPLLMPLPWLLLLVGGVPANRAESNILTSKVVHLTPGDCTRVLQLYAGDVLRATPFPLPTYLELSDCTLKVQCQGDPTMVVVGEAKSTVDLDWTIDDIGLRSVFLFANRPGKSQVRIALVNPGGEQASVQYRVEVAKSPSEP